MVWTTYSSYPDTKSMDGIYSSTSSEELIATTSTQLSTVELLPVSGISQSSEATDSDKSLSRKQQAVSQAKCSSKKKKDLDEIVTDLGVVVNYTCSFLIIISVRLFYLISGETLCVNVYK